MEARSAIPYIRYPMSRSIVLLSLLLLSCTPQIVSYVNEKSDFKSFETYRIVNPKLNNRELTDTPEARLIYETIIEHIENQMTERGYVKSSIAQDMTLRFELSSGTRVDTNINETPFSLNVSSRTIHQSILLLELHDRSKKLIWQGSYDLKNEQKEKQIKKVIENAVRRIFTSYGYRAKQAHPDESLINIKKKS